MRKILAFYAWQSDTPQDFNRHLIRIALEDAAKRITGDSTLDVELLVDYDTAGVPGQPPITQTILNKIVGCDIFIPDVSFVAHTEGGKLVPNPNVMTEYGYALCAKTHVAMMPVMNTAFGPPEELPFDMGHLRHPIQYHVEPATKPAERRAVRQALSQQIEEKLRFQVAATQPLPPAPTPFPEASPVHTPAMYCAPHDTLMIQHPYKFQSERAAYIRLFPTYADNSRVGLAKLASIFQARKPCPMSMVIGGIPDRNRFGPIIVDPQGSSTIEGLTQGFETGELWGVNKAIFLRQVLRDPISQQHEEIFVLPTITFEKLYVRVLTNYAQVAESDMNLTLPYTIELGAVGLNQVYLTIPGVHGRGEYKGPIMIDSFTRWYTLAETSQHAIKALLADYFADFYDLAAFSRADAFSSEMVAAHALPPI